MWYLCACKPLIGRVSPPCIIQYTEVVGEGGGGVGGRVAANLARVGGEEGLNVNYILFLVL